MVTDDGPRAPGFAGVPHVVPRPVVELAPLLRWLRTGAPAEDRLDFTAGTALPDGRLDLCKQALGPHGALVLAAALSEGPSPVRHLLLGTDALGDIGAAAAARTGGSGIETLYLGCNGITAGGTCRIADSLRASPQVVTGVWLKRNPLGSGGGRAAAELLDAARSLRTLDLVQTGLDAQGVGELADALLAAAEEGPRAERLRTGDDVTGVADLGGAQRTATRGRRGTEHAQTGLDVTSVSAGTGGLRGGRRIERLFVGGNSLGAAGAEALAAVVAGGAVGELYVSAARLGDTGALVLADALERAPYGRLARLSVASNGIGPRATARLVTAATAAGVSLLDLGRVKAAGVLGAADNRVDLAAADTIAQALAGAQHRLAHLVLTHTGMRSREAHRLLDTAPHAVTATRFVLGRGIAASVKRRLDALSAHIPPPAVPADVAAVRSVHRTAPPAQ